MSAKKITLHHDDGTTETYVPEVKPDLIDTGALGLALAFDGVGKDITRITFDTGVILHVPKLIFENMVFHLQEADPKPE